MGSYDTRTAILEARGRADRREAARVPIDYAAANKAHRRHKAALTRALNSGSPEQVQRTVIKTVREWNASNYPWPDDWSRWQVALNDALPWNASVLLEDLR